MCIFCNKQVCGAEFQFLMTISHVLMMIMVPYLDVKIDYTCVYALYAQLNRKSFQYCFRLGPINIYRSKLFNDYGYLILIYELMIEHLYLLLFRNI